MKNIKLFVASFVILFFAISAQAIVSAHWQENVGQSESSESRQDAGAERDGDNKKEDKKSTPSISEKTKGLVAHEGFFKFYWDDEKGTIHLKIDRWDQEFLYVTSLATGLGSNPVGLDRGKLGSTRVVHFRRVGPKVLMMQRNLRFRANTENQAERNAVQQSFAQSVIWGGTVEAKDKDGSVLVDVTDLLLGDATNVIGTLKRSDQGDFKLDSKRSAIFLPRCKSFPDNTEFESQLTFTGSRPGSYVRQTAPTASALSLRQHHSFIRLPDDQYRPRKYDVRSPSISITFADYAAPLDASLQQRWIVRHRLQKKDPGKEKSEPVEPIVYYIDSGAPKQIQDALVEGGKWWNQAFEAAGFINAFRVEILPDDADPMDVRYNTVQWVHRSTRGWSYGSSVTDPRTGEIIKGHVTLGSLRVRQDRLLNIGLSAFAEAPDADQNCASPFMPFSNFTASSPKIDPVEVALARIRQLSAHEIGHTLGFVHNFAASTYMDRASVMDYPAPRVKFDESGQLDLSDAYAVGIGEWDKVAVQYAYSEFPPEQEQESLDAILRSAAERKMIFVSDSDARPAGAAHPMGNLWDNGSDPLAEFAHALKVRKTALDQFDINQLPRDTTTADIQQYLVPVYLHHRYQLQAVGKLIGGVTYEFATIGDSRPSPQPIPFRTQGKAIQAMFQTLTPDHLRMPNRLVAAIGVKPYGDIRDQETFASKTGRVFDPLAAARVAADLTLSELLQHQRLARFELQTKNGNPTFDTGQLILSLVNFVEGTVKVNAQNEDNLKLMRIVRRSMLRHLISLADNVSAPEGVRAAALGGIAVMRNKAEQPIVLSNPEYQFGELIKRDIDLFLARPYPAYQPPTPSSKPPGSPIGQ